MNKALQADKRLIFFGIFALVLIVGGIALSFSDILPSKNSSSLIAMKTNHDFGEIDIFGGKVSTEFLFKNSGEDAITITSARTTCMCTEGVIDGKSFSLHSGFTGSIKVSPGETKTLTATFDPLAHGPDAVGPITRELYLYTNSTSTPQLTFKFEGNVVKNSNT